MANLPRIVYLVDDDERVLRSLGCLIRSCSHHVVEFSSGDRFLSSVATDLARVRSGGAWQAKESCVVLDINMPGLNGTALFDKLLQLSLTKVMPVIFITGHGDVAMAVSLVRAGAFHFLEKPVDPDKLVEVIGYGLDASASALQKAKEVKANLDRWNQLSPREKDVMFLAKRGLGNKQISDELGISIATTRTHRAAARSKLGIKNVLDLYQRASEFNADV